MNKKTSHGPLYFEEYNQKNYQKKIYIYGNSDDLLWVNWKKKNGKIRFIQLWDRPKRVYFSSKLSFASCVLYYWVVMCNKVDYKEPRHSPKKCQSKVLLLPLPLFISVACGKQPTLTGHGRAWPKCNARELLCSSSSTPRAHRGDVVTFRTAARPLS